MTEIVKFHQELEDMLVLHEDLRLKPYTCTAGKITIGVGRNLEDVGISEGEARFMLRNDIARVMAELRRTIPGFDDLSKNRRLALADMNFNLGLPRFRRFKNMLAAIGAADFERAADEMLNSKWANQVPRRAWSLAKMMREG